jgi:hypothetical protein
MSILHMGRRQDSANLAGAASEVASIPGHAERPRRYRPADRGRHPEADQLAGQRLGCNLGVGDSGKPSAWQGISFVSRQMAVSGTSVSGRVHELPCCWRISGKYLCESKCEPAARYPMNAT